jgi:hypothetical protein
VIVVAAAEMLAVFAVVMVVAVGAAYDQAVVGRGREGNCRLYWPRAWWVQIAPRSSL